MTPDIQNTICRCLENENKNRRAQWLNGDLHKMM